MTMNSKPVVAAQSETPNRRKPYSTPSLTLFGHVAALTRNQICSGNNDAASNVCFPGGNMATGIMNPSDRRLKQDIVKVGDHPLGIGLYLFSYRPEYAAECGEGRHFGVMADEVAQVLPQAVALRANGFLGVDYEAIGVRPAPPTRVH
jgi:hypothetical protein